MTVVSKTFAPIRGKVVRLTRLDQCGVPVLGSTTTWASKGFIHVNLKLAWAKGTDVAVTTADNLVTVNEPAIPMLQSVAVELQLDRVNPDVMTLLTGYQTVLDGLGNSVGFRGSSGIQLSQAFALEVWSDVAGAACDAQGNKPYGYTLIPYLKGGTLNDWNIDAGAASVGISANTHEGSGWGQGPYDVVDKSTVAGTVTPGGLLTPIGVKDHFHMQLTTLAPPAETNGLVALTSLTAP